MKNFTKKYFILAPSFHGVTLLSKFLNSHPNIVCLGDTYPTLNYDQLCGCKKRVSECDFWQVVYNNIGVRDERHNHVLSFYPGISNIDRLDIRLYSMLPSKLLRKIVPLQKQSEFITGYESFLQSVYSFVEKPSDDLVFVDGVKSVHRAKALSALGDQVDGVIHVVRSAGDFAKSCSKKEGHGKSFSYSLFDWKRIHSSIKRFGKNVPYIQVSYDSLCTDTESELNKLFQFMNLDEVNLDALKENMKKEWHFMGNSSVFRFNGEMHLKKYQLSFLEDSFVKIIS